MPHSYPVNDPSFRMKAGSEAASPMKILVIEDNLNDQELLYKQMRKANIENHILFVNDGLKAMELLLQDAQSAKSKVLAVFLDLNLITSSGLDVLRMIRKNSKLAGMPVVIMTGSEDPHDRKECERLKVINYLSKPISAQTLCMAIANLFHQPSTSPELVELVE